MPVRPPSGSISLSSTLGGSTGSYETKEEFSDDVFDFPELKEDYGDVDLDTDEARTVDEPETVDEAESRGLAVPPWLGYVQVPPTSFNPSKDYNASKPSVKPTRQFVYGYRCHDIRGNLAISSTGRLVYNAASLVISMDTSRNQIFFDEHTDDIISFAQSQLDPDIIMTGQKASVGPQEVPAKVPGQPPTVIRGTKIAPFFSIRNVSTRERIAEKVLLRKTDRFITACGFSMDGIHVALAVSSEDDKHWVCVYNINTKQLVWQTTPARNPIDALVWSTTDPRTFVTVGKKHIMAWTYKADERAITGTNMLTDVPEQAYYCALFTSTGNQVLVGGEDGGIYVYRTTDFSPRKVFRVHEKGVNTLCRYGKHFVSGGADRRLCILDNQLQPVWQVQFEFAVRAVAANADGDIAVGTRGAELYFIPQAKQQPPNMCVPVAQLDAPLMRGHYAGELWGVATNPRTPSQFCTVGEDNQIIIWDATTGSVVAKNVLSAEGGLKAANKAASTSSDFPINHMARAVVYSPNGQHVAVGFNDGSLSIFDTSNLKLVVRKNMNSTGKSQGWIEDLKYSPDGKYLAVPTHGALIRFLDVANNYKTVVSFTNYESAVTAVDWSADGTFVRSVTIGGMVTVLDVTQLPKAVKMEGSATALRDVQWATTTCKWAWETMGVWACEGRRVHDTSNINRVDACPARGIIAAATDFGTVNIFRYPAPYNSDSKFVMDYRALTGHSSHIPNVRFSTDGKYLFSTGGEDKTVIQWSVPNV